MWVFPISSIRENARTQLGPIILAIHQNGDSTFDFGVLNSAECPSPTSLISRARIFEPRFCGLRSC